MIVKNLWKKVFIYCGCHDEKVALIPNEKGTTLFYSCPKYYNSNRKPGEKACMNRIKMDDYQNVVEHIGDILAKNELNHVAEDLCGHKWSKRNISYEIFNTANSEYHVKVINHAANSRSV